LFDDLVECEEQLEKSDSQFFRRAFVRAAFAFNEGCLYWLKENVVKQSLGKRLRTQNIDVTKLLLLADETYRPNRQGKLESEPNRIPFANYCAFVFRTMAECLGYNPESLFSDNGWNEMQKALLLRHKITHPKNPADLEVTAEEMETVRESHRWLFNCLANIFIHAFKQIPSDDKS
jgi:hypothetical protein